LLVIVVGEHESSLRAGEVKVIEEREVRREAVRRVVDEAIKILLRIDSERLKSRAAAYRADIVVKGRLIGWNLVGRVWNDCSQ
jgi:hypothetical protein